MDIGAVLHKDVGTLTLQDASRPQTNFMSLPLEVRNMVYEAYIEDAQDEHGHQVCKMSTTFHYARSCDCQTPSRHFWVPFGFYAPHHHDRVVFHAPRPALWQVTETVRDEAMRTYFKNKICLDFRCGHGSPQAMIGALHGMHNTWPPQLVSMIRVLHINFGFNIWGKHVKLQKDLSEADVPLFRLETRDGGKELRVLALGNMHNDQKVKLRKRLEGVGVPRSDKFDGKDLIALAAEMMRPPEAWMEVEHGRYTQLVRYKLWILKKDENLLRMLRNKHASEYQCEIVKFSAAQ